MPAEENAPDLTSPLVGNESHLSSEACWSDCRTGGIKLAAQRHKLFIENSLARVVPEGSPNGVQCTVKDKQGIPGDSQERVEVGKEGGCEVL